MVEGVLRKHHNRRRSKPAWPGRAPPSPACHTQQQALTSGSFHTRTKEQNTPSAVSACTSAASPPFSSAGMPCAQRGRSQDVQQLEQCAIEWAAHKQQWRWQRRLIAALQGRFTQQCQASPTLALEPFSREFGYAC